MKERYVKECIIPKIINDEILVCIRGKYFSSSRLKVFRRKVILLFDRLTRPCALRRHNSHKFINIHSDKWIKMLGSEYYKDFLSCFISEGFIECDGDFRNGIKSLGYRVRRRVLSSGFYTVELEISKEETSLPVKQRADLLLNENPIIRNSAKWLNRITLPKYEHFADCDFSEVKRDGLKLRLQRFEQKDFYCVPDECGRLHTNFTNLDSEARHECRIYGEPLVEIDVKTCFPTMLSTFCTSPSEREKMESWIQTDFYQELYNKSGWHHKPFSEKRKSFKGAFNSWLNGETRIFKIENAMRNEFPVFCSQNLYGDRKGPKSLGHTLMKREAEIMVNGALVDVWKLDRDAFALSVHDSIYTTKNYIEYCSQRITEHFIRVLGIEPGLETHIYGPETLVNIMDTDSEERLAA